MSKALVSAVVLLCAAGCKSGSYEGHGVHWKLPRGVSFESESPGPPAAAQFSQNVKLVFYPLDGMPTETTENQLEEIAKKVIPPEATVVSRRAGSLPAGSVARFVFKEGANKALLYYLPGKSQVVVVAMSAPERDFNAAETHLDLSLGSLRFQ